MGLASFVFARRRRADRVPQSALAQHVASGLVPGDERQGPSEAARKGQRREPGGLRVPGAERSRRAGIAHGVSPCRYPHLRAAARCGRTAPAPLPHQPRQGRRAVATGGAGPPRRASETRGHRTRRFSFAPEGRRNRRVVFDRSIDRRRILRPFGTGRSVTYGSTSSVRLRRTSLVATARGPAGAESGVAHP